MTARRGLDDAVPLALAVAAGAGALGSGLYALLIEGSTQPPAFFDTALGLGVLLIVWAWAAPALLFWRARSRSNVVAAPPGGATGDDDLEPPVTAPSAGRASAFPAPATLAPRHRSSRPRGPGEPLLAGRDLVHAASAPSWPSPSSARSLASPDRSPARRPESPAPSPSAYSGLEMSSEAGASAKPEEMIQELDRLVDDLGETPKRGSGKPAPPT